MGIAIDQGFIDDIDAPVRKYLKHPVAEKNLDKRKEKITIRHLLTMSTGLDCNDWDKASEGQEDKIYRKKDWLQYILVFPEVDMVAVFTGGAYNSQEDKLPFAIMRDIFLPTFTTEK